MIKGISSPTSSLPYIIPFILFLALTGITPYIPGEAVWVYPFKTVLVGFLLFKFRHVYSEIQPRSSVLAFLVGLGVFVIWILPDRLGWSYPLLGEVSEFNPYDHIQPKNLVFVWIAFRLVGTSVVVPVMEEIFWRSFLIRYLIKPNFKEVAMGAFSWLSFVVTVLLFGGEHIRWGVGIAAGIIYNLLLYRTKSVFACILAHAVTNLALGIYVLITQQWRYW